MAYRIEQVYTGGGGGEGGYSAEYFLVDPQGNMVTQVIPTNDYYGGIDGYYINNSTGGGEGGGSESWMQGVEKGWGRQGKEIENIKEI